jgi:hypothetical protein
MREIKIIPLVLSIIGLIALGYAFAEMVGKPEFGALYVYFFIYVLIIFIVILLMSVGVLGQDNKFTW